MLQKGTKAPCFEGHDENGNLVRLGDFAGKKMYGKVTEGTLRTTYVIDENGIIADAIGKVDTKNHTAQIL
ncbi:MAG: hypothetical protein IKO98_02430 [Bacteroidales bacterium]|nr:hypothetical protein [Bacteroidales bacterium]MBR4512295.1 hypothetical protein [Bacteroidales bacterium]